MKNEWYHKGLILQSLKVCKKGIDIFRNFLQTKNRIELKTEKWYYYLAFPHIQRLGCEWFLRS